MPRSSDVADVAEYVTKKRKRGPQACANCRHHKIRCDANQPCRNCMRSDLDCIYGNEPITKGKSDAILETVLRLEERLSVISNRLVATNPSTNPGTGSPPSTNASPHTILSTDQTALSIRGALQLVHEAPSHRNAGLDNAILSSQHKSTTESVLAWPYFDIFPDLRSDYQPTFYIEQRRPKLSAIADPTFPTPDVETITTALRAFSEVVNFSYPILSTKQLADVEKMMTLRRNDDSIELCLSLLVSALGCASHVVQSIDKDTTHTPHYRHLATVYFDLYLRRLSTVHMETSTTATQCLFLTALFFSYLQRPLQSWSFINLTASKCRCLLYYNSSDAEEDTECLRRIFWSCFILESDYIAELAALPQSGVGEIESSVPYPSYYRAFAEDATNEQSSLYFLACVSMRRLLNRAHDLLYAPDSGVAFDDARFPHVVAELDHQLDEWRDCLPPSLRFSIDKSPAVSQHGGFLRQRYLTCRAVIYRPYLNQVLSRFSTGAALSQEMLSKSEICLNMCLLHILNLRPFAQTVLVDTWICSLSMASTTLLLLAACRVPELRHRIDVQVSNVGNHLIQLIQSWMGIHGKEISPSVRQSVDIIQKVDGLIRQELYGHEQS